MYMSHQNVYRVDATNMRAQMTESALREHACQEATFVHRYEKQFKLQSVFRKNNDTVLRKLTLDNMAIHTTRPKYIASK